MKKILGLVLLLGSSASVSWAGPMQFQLGYVFDSWTSNFIYSGTEHRMPASLRLTAPDFSLSADTAFVVGNYERTASGGFTAASYQADQLSDSALSASLDMKAGPSLVSNLTGTLNIGTGDTSWESQSADKGAIPFVFEPSFYHGRGWGGSLFWSLASTQENFNWGAGAGYLLTTSYNTGLTDQSVFNPGDSLVVMGSMGGSLSKTGTIGIQAFHTFAFQSKVTDPLAQFTSAESTVFTGQWLEKMGGDKFALNASYSFYGRGMVADQAGQQQREPENYLGDRLELRPFLGYGSGPGVSMMTGLVWDHVFPNGYGPTDKAFYQAGGDLFGVEQSVTFAMGGGAFFNLAGLYHYVFAHNAAQDNVTLAWYDVSFNRISFGTNVGFQW